MEALSQKRGPRTRIGAGTSATVGALLSLCMLLPGCLVAPSPPIAKPPAVVATPIGGHVTAGVSAADSVAGVTPVYVSVANGTDVSRIVIPSQVFAITASGQRVAPMPPGEAARRAGNASQLRAVLVNATTSGVTAGALGAGTGAAIGSIAGNGVSEGALIGGALAAAGGMFHGISRTENQADRQANQQIRALALRRENVRRNFTASGYVFFPEGEYREIDLILVNQETGDTEEIRKPWP